MKGRTTHRERREDYLGRRVQRARKRRNIKQSEMAEKLGVSQSLYSSYETGSRRMNAEVFLEISKILNVPLEVIVESDDEEYTLNNLSLADAETAAKAYEIALALSQDKEQNEKDVPAVQWASLGIDIANELNETGQQLIKDYIEVIRANPLMCKN